MIEKQAAQGSTPALPDDALDALASINKTLLLILDELLASFRALNAPDGTLAINSQELGSAEKRAFTAEMIASGCRKPPQVNFGAVEAWIKEFTYARALGFPIPAPSPHVIAAIQTLAETR